MAGDEVGLKEFIEELVESLGRRLSEQDKEIKQLKKDVAKLKKSSGGRPRIDKSVLRVLRGVR
jgi:hypothetical protein